ncbi:GyrI-like domain-containing protein [Alkaliphilus serpentinus]|uniref:GyrI-like small molecule binding domain-containing protein n=1 Tax=Alkaliphilus serpentinus TaxID=1482731 RepID=A0A833HR41_9FIRM|nr:GyrI-like domain-containing protein [Alkaliphilus serpentinus]KAB3532840.1 hypothetical protein F8153_01885 [Alkaliphilus serpentinus]
MNKVDYKRDFKELYMPKKNPSIVHVPPITFITIEGKGDPNREEFALETGALYSLSYAVKMSYKGKDVPKDFYDYTVFPLEGEWDLIDKALPATDKSNLKFKLMIRQPDFLTKDLFDRFRQEVKKKKPSSYLDSLRLETINEGLCCQILHIGSYDHEAESFKKMEEFCGENGYVRTSKCHREIYLSDPRRIEASKLRTILRFKVEAKKELKE